MLGSASRSGATRARAAISLPADDIFGRRVHRLDRRHDAVAEVERGEFARGRIAAEHDDIVGPGQTRDLKLQVILIGPEPRDFVIGRGPAHHAEGGVLGLIDRVLDQFQPHPAAREGRRNQGPVRGAQNVFVNRRIVKDRTIAHAISEAYSVATIKERSPEVHLFIRMPPDRVDVNVHPTKAEVRFLEQSLVHEVLRRALGDALGQGRAPELQFTPFVAASVGAAADVDPRRVRGREHRQPLDP